MTDSMEEDYRLALEELINNDRYQISNLTLIAKEQVEHAEAISRTIVNHISRAPPARKLPALYLLDSICKNVGSPYTIYFGRNLYSTFMGAYAQTDQNIRRKLEEMLKTWREPVPGSTSTQPVFQLAATQTIVDNLNKLRANAAPRYPPPHQAPGHQLPPRLPSAQPYRNTPTPPQMFAQHLPQHPPQHLPQRPPSQVQQYPVYQLPPTPQQPAQPAQPPPPHPAIDLSKLNVDIDDLTTDAKIECATHPMDMGAQKKLTTLQTLKEILESGAASPKDLLDIRKSIDQQVAKKHQAAIAASLQQPPQLPQPPPPTLPPGLNTTNLAELLRATASHNATPRPPAYPYSTPPFSHATPMPPVPPPSFSLIDQLKAAGLVSAAPTPPQMMTPPVLGLPLEITFTSASIKIPRPQMVTSFLTAKPNQCGTCGRRFTSDEVGKEKKARHLDWHFKTKARMIEAEKRGQNRSWYVDEREWMSSREYGDDVADEADGNNLATSSPAKKQQQQDFVRAPADPVLRAMPCPIDQEPFSSVWDEGVQDFVWQDCIMVGGRYYHASCYREVQSVDDSSTRGAASEFAPRKKRKLDGES